MEIVSIILNFILGSGVVGMLIFYSSKRRTANAQATIAEIDSKREFNSIERESIAFLSTQLQESWGKVETLQNNVNEQREELIGFMRQIKQLEIELLEQQTAYRRALIYMCGHENCKNRVKYENK